MSCELCCCGETEVVVMVVFLHVQVITTAMVAYQPRANLVILVSIGGSELSPIVNA